MDIEDCSLFFVLFRKLKTILQEKYRLGAKMLNFTRILTFYLAEKRWFADITDRWSHLEPLIMYLKLHVANMSY